MSLKKYTLNGAALLAMTQGAFAQSSVTLGGLVDLGVGRNIGNAPWSLQESAVANSRLTFRGTEDLGGGSSAFFGLEIRYQPDTGTTPARTFNGFSVVGLRTPYGTLKLGRDYTPAYLYTHAIEPWVGTTVAQLRDTGPRPGATNQGVAGAPAGANAPTKVRVSDAVFYEISVGYFKISAATGDSNQENGAATGPNREYSAAASYSKGPLYLAISYENPQYNNDQQWNLASKYTIGNATLYAGLARGRTDNNLAVRGELIAINYYIGPGEIKLGYAQSRVDDGPSTVRRQKTGLGYWHYLSKRTNIYLDVGREEKIAAGRKIGIDFGIATRF